MSEFWKRLILQRLTEGDLSWESHLTVTGSPYSLKATNKSAFSFSFSALDFAFALSEPTLFLFASNRVRV